MPNNHYHDHHYDDADDYHNDDGNDLMPYNHPYHIRIPYTDYDNDKQ